jgi:hypothetical protein
MNEATLPATFRQPSGSEGRQLGGPVPPAFETFYRSHLRFRSGPRLRAAVLAERYGAWALENEAPSMSLKEIRLAMLNIGHRHLRSNGMLYLDVQLAAELPGVADNFPVGALR